MNVFGNAASYSISVRMCHEAIFPFLRRLTFAIFGLLDLKLKLVNLIRFELISNSNSRLFNLKFLCKSTALRHDGMRVQRRHLFMLRR